MLNKKQSFIKGIIETCNELEDTIQNYCKGQKCLSCNFYTKDHTCRYKINLLMLLNGYRMATTDPSEKAQIEAYLKKNYPSFLVELYKQI